MVKCKKVPAHFGRNTVTRKTTTVTCGKQLVSLCFIYQYSIHSSHWHTNYIHLYYRVYLDIIIFSVHACTYLCRESHCIRLFFLGTKDCCIRSLHKDIACMLLFKLHSMCNFVGQLRNLIMKFSSLSVTYK